MPFDALRHDDDPGLPHTERLALGMVDIQIIRRDHWTVRAMQLVWRFFWLVWWGSFAAAIAASVAML